MSMPIRAGWARSRRTLAAAAGLAAALAVGGVVTASPASAGTNCAGGYHCVFWSGFSSARHSYFNGDSNFTNDTFNDTTYGSSGSGTTVNDNAYSASNSSTGGYYSRYYLDINSGGGMLFCVKPGSQVEYLAAALSASSLSLTTSNPGGCY
ncbi:hypothetical protein ABZ619_19520 [Streptomyces sp. NPDC007851]|uniref:hypothetical protein n=1 Tax=Streptomyces sp. NPDC007851 TaxID=3155008 RepID=UPI0034069977